MFLFNIFGLRARVLRRKESREKIIELALVVDLFTV